MKVLVLGNGAHVKKRVLPALNNIKSIENIIIGDRNTKNAVKIDSKNEIRNFNDELKSSEKYNFVIIATPTNYDNSSGACTTLACSANSTKNYSRNCHI